MKSKDIKFIITYCSPNTDEPYEKLVSEPISLRDILENEQVDFENGGYLRLNELEDEFTNWELIK